MKQSSSHRRLGAFLLAGVALAVGADRAARSQSPVTGGSTPPSLAQGQYPQGQFAQGQFPQNQFPQNQFAPGGRAGAAPGGSAAYGNGAGNPQYYTASNASAAAGGSGSNAAGANGTMIPPADFAAEGEATGSAAGEAAGETGTLGSIGARLRSGGPLMIPLAICSLVVMALAVERLVVLRRGRVIPRPFVRRFTECVQDGQLSYEEALEICDEFECPVAEVFHATVKRWGRPTVEVEQAVLDAGERVADGLRRYLRLFHAISNVAPLLGLLGTVLGMIQAFETLSSTGGGSPSEMLAAGISQALITTAAGLSVAIPAYLAYIYFSARADRYLVEIDAICQQVVDSISAEGLQSGSGRAASKRTKKAA
ncbi:MotA/TolQ/ExbB proton channel family protein [Candidatus Laterigemmans baculatus]|uniref:MotA/TolQ/ExbB proton channel family protein n=1 Tax=Candidatus Laterigemmans baculatus TaxID=2770505 RepID=UPI001F26B5B2|nr:MotA/TolQ/ExbB proton channel family protein [Candidatus Laterigemmans baculatus]